MCKGLNSLEHFFVFISTVTGCVTISALALLIGVSVDIAASSAVGIKICAITAGIKNY